MSTPHRGRQAHGDGKITPRDRGYLDLRALATYSCMSIRWLRNALKRPTKPLPHYRLEGKIVVRVDEFDAWMRQFHSGASKPAVARIGDTADEILTSLR